MCATMPAVPTGFAVRELDDDETAERRMTCGVCGRSWDDARITGRTPVPAGRCPFEDFHPDPTPTPAARVRRLRADLAELEARKRELEMQLTLALIAADRRPGDGSDQPGLFEVDEPKLF